MSENREEILADFQACTGVEDVGEAIFHLEETNWDLLRAISRVMPPDTQSFQPPPINDPDVMIVDDDTNDASVPSLPAEMAVDMAEIGNNIGHALVSKKQLKSKSGSSSSHENIVPSTSGGTSSSSSNRMLTFLVKYCDRVVKVKLSESANIGDLKLKLQAEINVSPCRQILSNWARLEQFESTPFSKLMLPDENELQLTIKSSNDGVSAEDENEVTMRLNGSYTLHVKFDNKTYDLKFQGTKTILEVKTNVYTFTNIHVRNQLWTGWPPNIDDNTMLALSGINYPEHELTVRKSSQSKEKRSMPQIVQIDSDDDEFEDASESFNVDDDYFIENDVPSKKQEPLIPEYVEDEVIGTITFNERFTARYGPIHPEFFQGSLEDALKEACQKPAKDRKILAIYLHHDASVLTNVFCTQLLGFESIMQMIEKNFILWGWDITFESNRQKFHTALANCLGPTAPMSLRNIPVDRLPAMVLIMKIRSATEVFNVINGNVGVNELLSTLIECVEVFSEHQSVEIKEEQERAEREMVKWEQDQAYHESLEADRAKEELRRVQEMEEREERERRESEIAETAARKEAHRKAVEASLPPEPPQGNGDDITKIRFRLPKGVNIERRFSADDKLQVLLDFLLVQGYPTDEFKVISSWPRRDLTALDAGHILRDLKLCPQETVILEER